MTIVLNVPVHVVSIHVRFLGRFLATSSSDFNSMISVMEKKKVVKQ